MKKYVNTLTLKLQPFTDAVRRYRITIFLVSFLSVYGFLVIKINGFINSEPTADVLSQQQQTVKQLRIDQNSIDSILELEEQNIEVRSLFKQARENPFTE